MREPGDRAPATATEDHPPVGPILDPARVLADADGCAALEVLARRLRGIGYDGTVDTASDGETPEPTARTLVAIGRGDTVTAAEAHAVLGADVTLALEGCGAIALGDGTARLTAPIFPMRSLYTLLPTTPAGEDAVYLGPDSILLFQRIWAARGYGDRAVDLATGNGFIAAALATRFDHVVAADLSARCASTAALVPVLNPHLRGRYTAVQMDVANGLRRGGFDLVTANAPWVPETMGPDGGPPRRFAAGGPTGCELPRRFLDDAAALLRPGGRAYVACLDVAFADGRRPIEEHLGALRAAGFEATSTASPLNDVFAYGTWAAKKAPGATAAQHVVIELRQPG